MNFYILKNLIISVLCSFLAASGALGGLAEVTVTDSDSRMNITSLGFRDNLDLVNINARNISIDDLLTSQDNKALRGQMEHFGYWITVLLGDWIATRLELRDLQSDEITLKDKKDERTLLLKTFSRGFPERFRKFYQDFAANLKRVTSLQGCQTVHCVVRVEKMLLEELDFFRALSKNSAVAKTYPFLKDALLNSRFSSTQYYLLLKVADGDISPHMLLEEILGPEVEYSSRSISWKIGWQGEYNAAKEVIVKSASLRLKSIIDGSIFQQVIPRKYSYKHKLKCTAGKEVSFIFGGRKQFCEEEDHNGNKVRYVLKALTLGFISVGESFPLVTHLEIAGAKKTAISGLWVGLGSRVSAYFGAGTSVFFNAKKAAIGVMYEDSMGLEFAPIALRGFTLTRLE